MRILTAELKKTLTLRFLVILLVAVAASFLLFRRDLEKDYRVYGQENYLAAQQEVLAMPSSERYDRLLDWKNMLQACQEWENYEQSQQQGWNVSISENMLLYKEAYDSGDYLKYCDSLYAERSLINELFAQVGQVENHKKTLEAAIADAKLKTSFALFAQPGTFGYRSQLATIEKLESMLHIVPRYDVSDGVLQFQDSAVTDLVGLVLILFLCTELMVTEQKNGMLPILRATKKGRLPLVASKAVAAFILTLCITAALWGSNLLYCGVTFGLGDLSRPVQSLTGFTTCTLEISVGQYIALFFLCKWMLYAAVGILCLVFAQLFQDSMPVWLTVGGILSVEYILCQSISSVSAWNVLKYANVGNLIFHQDWLSQYRNLNFFGFPVEVFTVSAILLAAFAVLSVLALLWLFCRRKVQVLPQLKIKLSWPKWLPRLGKSTKLVGHETWKLLIECGAALVLAVILLLNVQEPKSYYLSSDDFYYKNYMSQISGPVTEKTDTWLTAEQQRFADIRQEMRQINQLFAEGKITEYDKNSLLTPLETQLRAETVLNQQIIPQIQRAKRLAEEGTESWLLYEPGYEYLFGLGSHDKAGAAAILLAGMILCFANYYPKETTSGMLPLLNIYRKGRGATARCKLGLSLGMTTVLFVICQIPDYWYVLKNFGLPMLSAPLCSLRQLEIWGDGMTILGGLILYEGARLMTALSIVTVVMLLSLWTKNQVVTMVVSVGVFLLPVLLHLLGIILLDKVSFFLPVTGTALLQQPDKMALYYGFMLLLGAAATFAMSRYVRQGYQYRKRIQAEK